MKKLLLLAVFVAGMTFPAFAGSGAFKLSLWDNLAFAIPNNTQEIKGVDLGIGSHTYSVTGFQWDLIWGETRYLTGVSWVGGISKTGYAQGVQWAFVNMADDISGVQFGGVNMTTADVTGLQFGGVNMSGRSVVGAQIGSYNQAEYINGVQIGLVNYAKYIYGLQIGVFNIAENGFLPAMILVNGRF